jgi:hypothetical protein
MRQVSSQALISTETLQGSILSRKRALPTEPPIQTHFPPDNRSISLISAEDLIIHKCIAGRPRDQEDIEGILERQHVSIDMGYIRQWLGEFAEIIDSHDVIGVLESALERASTDFA